MEQGSTLEWSVEAGVRPSGLRPVVIEQGQSREAVIHWRGFDHSGVCGDNSGILLSEAFCLLTSMVHVQQPAQLLSTHYVGRGAEALNDRRAVYPE